jgi:ADP-ribose pyrophosphatase
MKKVVIHEKRRVFDGFFKIDEARVSFERFDGTMAGPVTRLSFERGDSVAALIHDTKARKVLFVNQFKYPTREKGTGWILETPAGMLNPGETPEAAIKREVLEEMGYAIEAVEPIATFYVSPGGSSERVILFYVEVSSTNKQSAGGGVESEQEDIETVEVPVDDLDRMVRDGSLADAKTLVGVLWLQKRLREG